MLGWSLAPVFFVTELDMSPLELAPVNSIQLQWSQWGLWYETKGRSGEEPPPVARRLVALYDDWLDYVVRKVERRSGVTLELTERERRWPLLFLWPKALRYIARRPGRHA